MPLNDEGRGFWDGTGKSDRTASVDFLVNCWILSNGDVGLDPSRGYEEPLPSDMEGREVANGRSWNSGVAMGGSTLSRSTELEGTEVSSCGCDGSWRRRSLCRDE